MIYEFDFDSGHGVGSEISKTMFLNSLLVRMNRSSLVQKLVHSIRKILHGKNWFRSDEAKEVCCCRGKPGEGLKLQSEQK